MNEEETPDYEEQEDGSYVYEANGLRVETDGVSATYTFSNGWPSWGLMPFTDDYEEPEPTYTLDFTVNDLTKRGFVIEVLDLETREWVRRDPETGEEIKRTPFTGTVGICNIDCFNHVNERGHTCEGDTK